MYFWKNVLELHFLKLFHIHLADTEKDSMLIIFLFFYKPHPLLWPKRGHILEGKNILTTKLCTSVWPKHKILQKTQLLFLSYWLNHVI